MKLTFEAVKATNEAFKRLNSLRRWTSFVTEDKYNELAKQALNCVVTYILAKEAEHQGKEIVWERFPKIAIYRAFQKVYVYFDIPEHVYKEVLDMGNIPIEAINTVTKEIMAELADAEFADFICEETGTYEERIYKAATKIATYIEFIENQVKFNGAYKRKLREIVKSLEEYKDIPGVTEFSSEDSPMFKILYDISKLRNQNRWAAYAYNMECSVLGHLFDTAVFAYFMSLEQKPEDQKRATNMFFFGIYHDVAETWTKDIPSPIKDRIPGFRKATEAYEMKKIEENIYSVVPEYMKQAFKQVMFEDEGNREYKKLLKGADYLSADSECWRQYKSGSREPHFYVAVANRDANIRSGKEVITPVCKNLHEMFEDELMWLDF